MSAGGHKIFYQTWALGEGIRLGITPDIKITSTIKGIKGGKDEVLQRAIQFALTGK